MCEVTSAQEQLINLDKFGERTLIGASSSYYIDKTKQMGVNEILGLESASFIKNTDPVPNFGLGNHNVWLKFSLISNNAKEYLLDFSNPLANIANLYYVKNGNIIEQNLGDKFPYKNRQFDFPNFIYKLDLTPGTPQTYYLLVNNHEQCQIPLHVGTKERVLWVNNLFTIANIIFVTILIVMFLYNLFLYLSIGDVAYFHYILYILSIGLAQIGLRGYGFKWLWPNTNFLQQHQTFIFGAAVAYTSLKFFQQFIGKHNIPKFFLHAIQFVFITYLLANILAFAGQYKVSYVLMQILAFLSIAIALIVGVRASRKGVVSANYFLVAWLVFIIGTILFVLKDFNIISYSIFSVYTMPFGSALEVLLLSFALASKIKKLQQGELRALEENKKMVQDQNIILDTQVQERTKDLELAMQELKRSEVELVNKEKMSSLGVLTAGIAHEINNPINFVTSSIKPLRRDLREILEVYNKYSELTVENITAEKLHEINRLKLELDTPYLLEEIELLLNGIEEGAVRTSDIVKGLQKFSRSDEHMFRENDIIDGIENTLTILSSQIKNNITIIKDYQNNPQLLNCSIGKLNQVFLNMLTNSIHAVMDSDSLEKTISIKARIVEDGNILQILISDNGVGMSPDVAAKVFDPFYTTKEVGKGTGLGMAISLGIINDHNGRINVASELGKGSTMEILLPIT